MFLTNTISNKFYINESTLFLNEYENLYNDAKLENSLMLECVNIEHKALLTEDAALIQEAENEVEGKQVGLLQKIVNGIKNFCKQLINLWNKAVEAFKRFFTGDVQEQAKKNAESKKGKAILYAAGAALTTTVAAGIYLYAHPEKREAIGKAIDDATSAINRNAKEGLKYLREKTSKTIKTILGDSEQEAPTIKNIITKGGAKAISYMGDLALTLRNNLIKNVISSKIENLCSAITTKACNTVGLSQEATFGVNMARSWIMNMAGAISMASNFCFKQIKAVFNLRDPEEEKQNAQQQSTQQQQNTQSQPAQQQSTQQQQNTQSQPA